MSETTTIQATKRDLKGKGAARKLRRQGMIPAVVYGHGYDAVSITVEGGMLNKMFKPGHEDQAEYQLFSLKIDGADAKAGKMVMLKEIQRHPLQQHIEHIDFFAVKMDEEVVAPVHIRLHGKPAGVKLGGIMRHILREVEVKSLPANIPSHIDIEVEHMQIGDSVHVSDLPVPDNVQILNDPSAAVVNILAPTISKTAEGEEESEAAAGESTEAAS